MKNKKYLAIALSAGLVFAGGFVAKETTPVAYAAQTEKTKADYDKELTAAKALVIEKELNLSTAEMSDEIVRATEERRKAAANLVEAQRNYDEAKVAYELLLQLAPNTEAETNEGAANLAVAELKLKTAQIEDAAAEENLKNVRERVLAEKQLELEEAKKAVTAAEESLKKFNKQLADYAENFLPTIKNFSQLTAEDKVVFEGRIKKAISTAEIYNIYDEALKLNEFKKTVDPLDSQTPKKGDNLRLPNGVIWLNEGDDIAPQRIVLPYKTIRKENATMLKGTEKVVTKGINGYIELKGKTETRVEPVDEVIEVGTADPTPNWAYWYKYYPYLWTTSYNPYYWTTDTYYPYSYSYLYPYTTLTTTTPVVTIANTVVVPAGYKYIKAGTYDRTILLAQQNMLKEAVKDNKAKQNAAQYLLDYTPKTVAKVKDKLVELINKSVKLQNQAEAAIAEIDAILK